MNTIPHHLEIKPYCFDISSQIDLANVKKSILDFKEQYPVSNKSNVYAWHTDYFLHTKTNIFDDLLLTISNIVKSLDGRKEYLPNLVHSWAIVYQKSDSTINHNHSPALYSTVLYVDVDENSAPTIFENNVVVHPIIGQLIIFSGTLNHYVPVCTDEKQRIVFCTNFS